MGYPDKKAEIDILKHETRRSLIQKMSSLSSIKELDLAFLEVQKIHVSDKVADYIWRLLDDSRKDVALLPLSPRCGIDIVKSSKCLAYLNHRDHVLPDDVQEIFPYVSNHRLAPDSFDKGFEAAHLILSRVSIL
jgi:MoxR-like ATPase